MYGCVPWRRYAYYSSARLYRQGELGSLDFLDGLVWRVRLSIPRRLELFSQICQAGRSSIIVGLRCARGPKLNCRILYTDQWGYHKGRKYVRQAADRPWRNWYLRIIADRRALWSDFQLRGPHATTAYRISYTEWGLLIGMDTRKAGKRGPIMPETSAYPIGGVCNSGPLSFGNRTEFHTSSGYPVYRVRRQMVSDMVVRVGGDRNRNCMGEPAARMLQKVRL